MRGDDREDQGAMWSYVKMGRRIPVDHPLRAMRPLVVEPRRELAQQGVDELRPRPKLAG